MLANVVRDAAASSSRPRRRRCGGRACGSCATCWPRWRCLEASSPRVEALLDLALDFTTWQALVRRSGLSRDEAVELLVDLVGCATRA